MSRTTLVELETAFERWVEALRARGGDVDGLALDYYAAGGGWRVVRIVEHGAHSTATFGDLRVSKGVLCHALRLATASLSLLPVV